MFTSWWTNDNNSPIRDFPEFKKDLELALNALEATARESVGPGQKTIVNTELKPGDYVLWKDEAPQKLDARNRGPWKVHDVLDNNRIVMQSILDGSTRSTHIEKLMMFDTDAVTDTMMLQLASFDQKKWEVERVVSVDWKEGTAAIKWVGFENITEEPLSGVKHLEEMKRLARKARKNLKLY
ncbi:hypothetical protein J8273_5516 [Carpediemonas membranifera]|uniref:Uncharacterized protein n=1 Tax=Carpediemonas membranifera TaxID=201153 RepID=A0A8J6E0Q3_9EUKA|nr:hypothetical protein J8273_5516 [Carpediemonas membranifera]|eukprot:KAG9392513.1 hypothetical protein J8273_5516 [Carpediemonas membranifera]